MKYLDDLLADPVQIAAEVHERLRGGSLALADHAEQDVLGTDVVVAEVQRLTQRELQRLLGPRRIGDTPRWRLLAPGRCSPQPPRGQPAG